MKKITVRGVLTTKGEPMVYGQADLENFYKINKLANKSRPILMSIEIQPEGKKDRIIAYINAKIKPEIKVALNNQGYRITADLVETFILNATSFKTYDSINDLNRDQLIEFIEELKHYSAENLGYYIDDSEVI